MPRCRPGNFEKKIDAKHEKGALILNPLGRRAGVCVWQSAEKQFGLKRLLGKDLT